MTAASLISQTSPDVLANKGVPVEFLFTRNGPQGIWESHPGGQRKTEHIRLTNWTIKQLEDRFGSLSGWDQAMTDRMFGAVITTLSIALGPEWPEQRVAEAMVPGRMKDYRLAISGAQAIAMGRDPKETLNALMGVEGDPEPTETTTAPPTTETGSGSTSSTPTDGSGGLTSGPDGWGTVITGTSSGTSPSDSSSPSSSQWQ